MPPELSPNCRTPTDAIKKIADKITNLIMLNLITETLTLQVWIILNLLPIIWINSIN